MTMPDGRVVAFEIDEKVRENLLNGWDDIALTESYRDRIAAFKAKVAAEKPAWATRKSSQEVLEKAIVAIGNTQGIAKVEAEPSMEGRQMVMVLSPR